jgi:exodeoxyribonuclease V beta subunit
LDVRDFALTGSRLIEASAGTGKTYTIALLYVRYILGHGSAADLGRSLTPGDILVVTFTEAASQELRDRIRQRLSEAARWFHQPALADTQDPLHTIVQDYDQAQKTIAAQKLARAAETMDEAAVSTIHSWCYRMLREHAFDSNLVFSQQLNTNPGELLTECVEDYWRQHFYPYGDQPDLAAAIHTCWQSPADLSEQLLPLIGKTRWQPVFAGQPIVTPTDVAAVLDQAILDQQARRQWQERTEAAAIEARQGVAQDWTTVAELLRAAPLNAGIYHRGGTREDLLAVVQRWAAGQSLESPELKKIRLLGTGKFNIKKGGREPEHPSFAAIARWGDLWDSQPEPRHPPLRVSLLLHARQWVAAELQRRLWQRGELSYDDMLIRLHAALHGPHGHRLAAAIRQKFPVALIDEFQDTDPIQYEIFDRIYRIRENDAQSSLIMIGDPKQAIYAFRGADIYTYLRAKQDCGTRCESLGTNYRSTAGMVRAVNHVFHRAEQFPAGAFRFRDSSGDPIPFQPVAARGRSEVLRLDGQIPRPLQLWYLLGTNAHGVTGPRDYREQMAQATASQIVRWLQWAKAGRTGFESEQRFRRLQPRDIAILVRTGREAAQVRQALQRRGVSSVYLSDKDSVFETPAARDVQRWLMAVAHPTDERLVKTALATGSLKIDLPELRAIFEQEDRWDQALGRFRHYQHLWQTQGVLPMLRALLWDFDAPKKWLAEPSGERALTNLLHLAEWLQQISASVDGELALIRRLTQQIDHPTDEQILRLESDADLIKVVTIHKSKGLEYPLVLLPFICTYRDIHLQRVVDFHERSAREPAYDLLTELSGHAKSAPESYRQADQERLNEDLRLLYVALTRAQHALWLGLTPIGNSLKCKKHQLGKSALGYVLFGPESVEAAQIPDRIAAAVADCPEILLLPPPEIRPTPLGRETPPELGPARRANARTGPRWWIASYSALKAQQSDAPETAVSETLAEENWDWDSTSESRRELDSPTPPANLHQFPRGPQAGTFLHGLLEWATDRGFNRVAQSDSLRQSFLQRMTHARGWSQWDPILDDWLRQLLQRQLPLGDSWWSLSELTAAQTRAELEFWFETQAVNTRTIDRIVTAGTLDGRSRPPLEADVLHGLLKGFIDLVCEHRGRYYIVDWKSNYLGPTTEDYGREDLCQAIADKRYDLQYVLYTVALHRHLQHRLPGYQYHQHMGGVAYIFLRGLHHPETAGVHFECPAFDMIESLDHCFTQGSHKDGERHG